MYRFPCFVSLSCLLVLAAQAHPQGSTPAAPSQSLQIGRAVERAVDRVAAGDTNHVYTVSLSPGQLFRVGVEPRGVNFHLRSYAPDGTWLGEIASWQTPGEEAVRRSLAVLAETPGTYRLEMRAARMNDTTTGSYRLNLEAVPRTEATAESLRSREAISWIAAKAHPLASVEAGHGFQDLMPLKQILGNVRVIGLGEATHGSREFFQVKHRLLEFLVREMGFTLFGMELDEGGAKEINDFVLRGEGDRARVLTGQGMSQWDTQEVAAMLDWMRAYNLTAPEGKKVHFAGFDFQANDRSRQDVIAYLRRVAPERVATADSTLAPLVRRPDPARLSFVEFYTYSPAQKAATVAGVKELFEHLETNQQRFVRSTSAAEFEEVLQSARRMMQFVDAHSRTGYEQNKAESGVATRDRYMAENVARTVAGAGPQARMVLWSHNEHVRRDAYNMGYYLGQRYGSRYYSLALDFDRGGFRALEIAGKTPAPLKEFTVGPAFQESVSWAMRRAGKGSAFVDFRGAPQTGPAAEWLRRPHAMRSIGNGYAPGNPGGYYRAPVVLGTSYDGILFVEQTTPARGNQSALR